MKQAKETKRTTHNKPNPPPTSKNKEQKITNKKTNWRTIATVFKLTDSHQYPDTNFIQEPPQLSKATSCKRKKLKTLPLERWLFFLKRILVGEWKLWNPFWVLFVWPSLSDELRVWPFPLSVSFPLAQYALHSLMYLSRRLMLDASWSLVYTSFTLISYIYIYICVWN